LINDGRAFIRTTPHTSSASARVRRYRRYRPNAIAERRTRSPNANARMTTMDDELDALRENLPPTDDQALASAINAHAARTVCVLNALSASVEARLARAAQRVAEAEARTRLLERALDAEAGEATTRDARAVDARLETVETVETVEGGGVDAVAVEETVLVEETVPVDAPPPPPPPPPPGEPPEPANAMVNDPKYGIYFKMIKMGVPEQAVRTKMALDGVDASVLDANRAG
jgi:WASH complex subunit CCDC53